MRIDFPVNLEELWSLLADEPEGKIMAGGTDLLVQINKKNSKPKAIFCMDRMTELKQIELDDSSIYIGAAVPLQRLLELPTVQSRLSTLAEAIGVLGSPPIRHGATLGGNICTASPAGDTIPPLHVLDAQIEIRSALKKRIVPMAQFILGPGKTVLEPGEIVTGVHIPWPHPEAISAFYKVGKRRALAVAVASLAVLVVLDEDKRIKAIRLAWGSVGEKVLNLPQVERFLIGQSLAEAVLLEAAKMVASQVSPRDDLRASAAYRRQVAGNLLLRMLQE